MNNQITITYNHLNLPTKVEWTDGRSIEWIYDANGTKLRKTVRDAEDEIITVKDYLGNVEYTNNELEAIYHTEGRITPTGNTSNPWQYEYTIKDHLGNGRVWWTWNETSNQPEVLQTADYYPFGMTHAEPNASQIGLVNQYKYNGKEFNNDFSLDWSDYGARFYDAQIGRWHSIDNKADKWNMVSPYIYALDNPIIYFDTDGQDVFVAFTGGFRGGGKTGTIQETGTTGRVLQQAEQVARENGVDDFDGRVIKSGTGHTSSVNNAVSFIIENRESDDEKVVLYGYSRGGDLAVRTAKALKKQGIEVELVITVDPTKGQLGETDREISNNVKKSKNYFQREKGGVLGLRGDKVSAEEGNDQTEIVNDEVTNTTHGLIDEKVVNDGRVKEDLNRAICPCIDRKK